MDYIGVSMMQSLKSNQMSTDLIHSKGFQPLLPVTFSRMAGQQGYSPHAKSLFPTSSSGIPSALSLLASPSNCDLRTTWTWQGGQRGTGLTVPCLEQALCLLTEMGEKAEILCLLGCRSSEQVSSDALAALPTNPDKSRQIPVGWVWLNFYSKSSPQRRSRMVQPLSPAAHWGAVYPHSTFSDTVKEPGHMERNGVGRTDYKEHWLWAQDEQSESVEPKAQEKRWQVEPTVPTNTPVSTQFDATPMAPPGNSCPGLEHLTQTSWNKRHSRASRSRLGKGFSCVDTRGWIYNAHHFPRNRSSLDTDGSTICLWTPQPHSNYTSEPLTKHECKPVLTSAAAHPWIRQTCSGNTWRITAFVLEMSRRSFLPLFPKLHCVTTLLYALLVKTLTRVYRRTCRFHANVTALYVRLLIICRLWCLVPQGGLDWVPSNTEKQLYIH